MGKSSGTTRGGSKSNPKGLSFNVQVRNGAELTSFVDTMARVQQYSFETTEVGRERLATPYGDAVIQSVANENGGYDYKVYVNDKWADTKGSRSEAEDFAKKIVAQEYFNKQKNK